MELPAPGSQDGWHRLSRAAYDSVLPPDHAFTPVLLDDRRIEQPGQRHPPGLGPRAFVLAARGVSPPAKVAQDGGQIPLDAIAAPRGHTPWREHAHDLVPHTLGHRQGPWPHLRHQEPCALRVAHRPHPVATTLQALEGLLCPDRAISDATPHGLQLVKLQRTPVDGTEARGG